MVDSFQHAIDGSKKCTVYKHGEGGRPAWSKRRIEDVNVDADVNIRGPNSVLDRGDYRVDAVPGGLVDIPGCDDVEAASLVVLHVSLFADQGGADSDVDGCVAN